jgi:hypothetical protein
MDDGSVTLNMYDVCWNIVTFIKVCAFVGTICDNWVAMHRTENTKRAITFLQQPQQNELNNGEFSFLRGKNWLFTHNIDEF